jgi:hypothetical protein
MYILFIYLAYRHYTYMHSKYKISSYIYLVHNSDFSLECITFTYIRQSKHYVTKHNNMWVVKSSDQFYWLSEFSDFNLDLLFITYICLYYYCKPLHIIITDACLKTIQNVLSHANIKCDLHATITISNKILYYIICEPYIILKHLSYKTWR